MQKRFTIFALGLATFAMLFGAGNVVFPLALGREMGNMVFYAIAGFTLTAVIVPLLGLIAVMLFEGNYRQFLGTIGRIPGEFIAFLCMILIGPFACIPRCLVLSHASIQWHIPWLSLFAYSIIASSLVFAITLNKGRVIEILGKVLGPIKLTLLLSVAALGLISFSKFEPINIKPLQSFLKGFNDGYFTMDLLCTIFFSALIYAALKKHLSEEGKSSDKNLIISGLKVCLIGGGLLGIVYIGFCLLAAMYGTHVYGVERAQLLSALTTYILGHGAGILANTTVAVACLTTAIALTTVFADYVFHEIFGGKYGYRYALLITTVITFAMTNLGFEGIMNAIEPIIVVFYPALIALCLVNIASKLWGFKYIKLVVFSTLFATLALKYGPLIISKF
jgi:LIVCS family branched-chain amino acid:cation transporter